MEEVAQHGGLPELGPTGGGPDLISALPDDLLLQVLVRTRCTRAAACTSLLSRRWSHLWSRLAEFTFRDATPRLLRPALDSLAHVPDMSLLDIHVPEAPTLSPHYYVLYVADVGSLLRAVTGLSPVELRFNVSRSPLSRRTRDMRFLPPPMNLPSFHRATSIDICGMDLFLPAAADPPASFCMFPALEVLSFSGCHVAAAALLLHCPRLRVLRATGCFLDHAIRSASPRELLLENKRKSTGHVHIDCKQLTLSINTPGELRLSISAPIMEKVLWQCCYSKPAAGIGPWALQCFPHTELGLAQEIEKHLVLTNFSVLDLHFNTTGHAFGAFGEKAIACPVNCPCDEPKNWRSETISLINLEEVEIKGLGGEDHEFDFLSLILKCAPRLKRMTMRPSHEVTTSNDDWGAKIYDILKVYPSVGCNVFPYSGPTHSSQSGDSHPQIC
ncbi:hypothetical protein VPH35_075133 [Triticum aestivum]